jgi:hypothetical protein
MPQRRWLLLIAAPAAVAVWSGWVGLGGLCGFGVIHPLPGIWGGLRLNTAITLPVGVEAYGAYALGAWLAPGAPEPARVFARRSAIGALCLGMGGQVIYHLLAAAHATAAPWPVVVLVSCLPVITLGFGAALTHLLRPARTGGAGVADPAGAGLCAGPDTGPARSVPAVRIDRPVVNGYGGPQQRALPGVDRTALVTELSAQIRAAEQTGQEWRPDYEALMARTGYRRSWCEKAVRAARDLAAAGGPGTDGGPLAVRTEGAG